MLTVNLFKGQDLTNASTAVTVLEIKTMSAFTQMTPNKIVVLIGKWSQLANVFELLKCMNNNEIIKVI